MSVRSVLARAPLVFALVLWFGATFYFFGDTGKHSDDYTVAMRNRATGAIDFSQHPWVRWPYFWRPLHLAHASAVNTISWNHPWIGHFELATIHGLVAWLLAEFLTRLNVRRVIARTVALLFLVCPFNAEAVFWTSASCNAVASLFLLWTLELARRQGIGPAATLRTVWIAVLAFVTACWYEPAAAALAAVPLVSIAAGRGSLRSRVGGGIRCTAAAGVGCLAYVGLLVATAPSKNRGAMESLVPLHDLGSRTRLILRDVVHAIIGGRGRDIITGSIENGWKILEGPTGMVFLGVVIFFAALSVAAFASGSARRDRETSAVPGSNIGIAVAGVAIFMCAWIPIIAVEGQGVELRSLYVPMLGLAFLAAAIVNGAADLTVGVSLVTQRCLAALAATTTLAAALLGTVGMIGFQAEFRLNAIHDRGTVEQLGTLVPEPAPGTLFLPLRVDTHGANTGRPDFDRAIHGVFDTPWSCRGIVNMVFHRTDVNATPVPWWIKNLDEHGFTFLRLPGVIAWNRCVPFVVEASGKVRLLRHLTIVPGEGAPFVVEFPRVPSEVAADETASVRLRETDHGTDHAHSVVDVLHDAAD